MYEKNWDQHDLFVELHNKKVRNFWHNRPTTISCRVRSTKTNNADCFRKSIIAFLYHKNLNEYYKISKKLTNEDYEIFQKSFGFDEKDLSNKEKFYKAMEVRCLSKSEVFSTLGLINVVSTQLPMGYYKEIFYLKSIMNGFNPQFCLRCLYHIDNNLSLEEIIPEDLIEEDNSRFEIIYLVENILLPRIKLYNKGSGKK